MRSDNGNRPLDAILRSVHGLRGRLTALFLLLALVPLAIAAVVSFRDGRAMLEEHIGLQLSAQAHRISESVGHLIVNGRTSLKNWAQLSVMYDMIGDDPDGRITSALTTLVHDQSLLISLMTVTPAGKIVAASEPHLLGESVVDQDWFLRTKRIDPERDDAQGLSAPDLGGGYNFLAPIVGPGKNRPLLGYLKAYLSRERLAGHVRTLLSASSDVQASRNLVFIVDRMGTAILDPSDVDPVMTPTTDSFPIEQLQSLRKRESGASSAAPRWVILTDADHHEYLAGLTDLRIQSRAGNFVVLAQPLDEAYQSIYSLRSEIFGIGFGLACLATILAIAVATRLGRPMEQLTRSAEAVSNGDFAPNDLPVKRRDEIGALARAFDHMREDLLVLTRDLEQRVQARTAELSHANESLQVQMKERERAERGARASEERFNRMVSQVKDYAIVMLNPEGRVVHWNDGAQRIKGYKAEDVVGRHFACFYPAEDIQAGKPAQLLTQAIEQGSVEHEGWYLRRDGSQFWAHVTLTPVRDDGGQLIGFSILMHDLTRQKESEQDKASLEAQLRQAQKMEAVGRLAGGIAHDFNNLLTVIGGYTQMLQMGITPTDPLYPAVEEISKSAERAASLTQQLLAFSRKQVMQPTQLSLNDVVVQVEKMLRQLIGEDIRMDTILADNLAPVKADRGQVEQIVMNLAINARDAMPKGGRLILRTGNTAITPEHREPTGIVPPGHYVSLEVRDTGCGMDEATKARVFEPFFTTKEPGKGTGLGLATAYGIAKQSGGFITVESELGKGATFTLYFPALQAEIQAVPKTDGQCRITRSLKKEGATVLLVEDESGIRRLLQGLLTSQGYKVLTAPDGESGLAVGSSYNGTIDLLLTDVIMPKLSGAEMAKRLSEKHPRLKVLYMSGYTDESIVQHGVLEQGAAFLAKPFKPQMLVERVQHILAMG
jgi:PAS domain S-box-containing protein